MPKISFAVGETALPKTRVSSVTTANLTQTTPEKTNHSTQERFFLQKHQQNRMSSPKNT